MRGKEYNAKEKREKVKELDISETLDCSHNAITNLNLNNCRQLKNISCGFNKLTNLDLTNLNHLERIECCDNYLKSFDYSSLNLDKLTYLNITDNNLLEQDLSVFKPLDGLGKLKSLHVSNTNIDSGLEYLLESVNEIYCSSEERPEKNNYPNKENTTEIVFDIEKGIKNITKVTIRNCPKLKEVNINNFVDSQQLEISECANLEMFRCGNNQLTELNLSQNKLLIEIVCAKNKLTQLTLPNQSDNLQKLICYENELTSLDFLKSCHLPKLESLVLNDNNFPPQDLEFFVPFRELKVLRIDGIDKPSYFTGSLKPLQELKKLEILNIGGTDITHGLEYLPESVKEIDCTPNRPNAKVSDIYEELQTETEQERELRTEENYNTSAPRTSHEKQTSKAGLPITNSASQAIIDQLCMNQEDQHEKSEEVSKMGKYYDNSALTLIAMDSEVVLHQPSYIEGDGYDATTDKVELTLTQALYAIKNRKRTEPLDGIYSILGLLPYGKDVTVDYSTNNTSEKALVEVMKVAIANGYAEPLSWHGESNNGEGLCCLPQIDKEGSASVMGSVGKVGSILKDVNGKTYELISFTDQGLEFDALMPHYTIHQTNQNTHKLESGFEIEGGLFRKEVVVKPREMEEVINLSLLGTKETLDLVQEGNLLVVLHKELFGTNKLFALLVKETNQTNTYHRLGLVELANSEGVKFAT
ncbi:15864_t:CDS:10 [Funneliformis geosporum]|uniref:15864_t:CDS:1 n=1 Tax=Funneliformis geosporum TaxID=1117311 RepID=A0A9W4SFV5_9GLOM|nr:15864_t:CDS:10 [Funneliformis geosporum]